MTKLRTLGMCLLLFATSIGCEVETTQDEYLESESTTIDETETAHEQVANTLLAAINLDDGGRIEYRQNEDGEIVLSARFTDPNAELVGIDRSPLEVYRHYAGTEPSKLLVEAYEHSLSDLPIQGDVNDDSTDEEGSTEMPYTAAELAGYELTESAPATDGGDIGVMETLVHPFSHYCHGHADNGEDELQESYCYLDYETSLARSFSGYKSYYTVRADGTSVSAVLKYLSDGEYKTYGQPYKVPAGTVLHLYHTGGGWRTRRIEVNSKTSVGSFSTAIKVQTKRIVVITLHGAFSGSISLHGEIAELLKSEGVPLSSPNWGNMGSGDTVSTDGEASDIASELNELVETNGQGYKSRIRLLIVGKSAGGVSAWNALRRKWSSFSGLDRVALVLIDAHGSATNDRYYGTYSDGQSLYWPSSWPTQDSKLAVWNIFQHRDTITGASFPSSHVFKNIEIDYSGADHFSIPSICASRQNILEAIRYLKWGRSAPSRMSLAEAEALCEPAPPPFCQTTGGYCDMGLPCCTGFCGENVCGDPR